MTPEERERILGKVRKMMDRAKDPNAPDGEVEASLAFVRKFMDQFNIEEAEVLQSQTGQNNAYDSIRPETAMERTRGRFHANDYTLARAVCLICDVKSYRSRGYAKGKDTEKVVFYGMPRDTAVAKELLHLLVASMTGMAKLKCGTGGWSQKHNAYGSGFADRVYHRAAEMKRQAKQYAADAASGVHSQEATAGAIVLVKEDLLKRYAQANLSLGKARGSRRDYSGSNSYGTGWSDGASVSLGTDGISGKEQGKLR